MKDDEKWKKREDLDDLHLSNKRKRTIELNDDEEEDDASSDDDKRSPTPNSVSYSKPKRPDGCKKDKTESVGWRESAILAAAAKLRMGVRNTSTLL